MNFEGKKVSDTVIDAPEFFKFASLLRSKQSELSNQVEANWTECDQAILVANELALSCYASVMSRKESVKDKPFSEHLRHRAAIHSDFVKGLSLVEFSLKRGLYGSAATLLRREMEAVNNCYAHRIGKQKDKKNPHVKPHKHLDAIYNQLSGIAHTSDRELMSYLSGGAVADLAPRFDKQLAEHYLQTHISCLISMAMDLSFERKYSAQSYLDPSEEKYAAEALAVLTMTGFLNLEAATD